VCHVYRDESGALVMHDDAASLVAQELGRPMIEVRISRRGRVLDMRQGQPG
jgi:hypothetical protein